MKYTMVVKRRLWFNRVIENIKESSLIDIPHSNGRRMMIILHIDDTTEFFPVSPKQRIIFSKEYNQIIAEREAKRNNKK
jgi:hypothetical protein